MSENGLVCDMGALKLGRPPLHLVPTPTVKGDGDDLKNLILGREELGSIRPFPPFSGRVQGPMLKGLCVFLLCRFSPRYSNAPQFPVLFSHHPGPACLYFSFHMKQVSGGPD